MYHKDTALYARKIDWLLLHRRDELRRIMHDNGNIVKKILDRLFILTLFLSRCLY